MPQDKTETSSCHDENSLRENSSELPLQISKTTSFIENEDMEHKIKCIDGKLDSVGTITEESKLDGNIIQEDLNIVSKKNVYKEHEVNVKEEANFRGKGEKEDNLSEMIHHNDIYPIEIPVECPTIPDKEEFSYQSEMKIPYMTVLEAIKDPTTKKTGYCESEGTLSSRTSQNICLSNIPKHVKDVVDDQSKPRRINTPKNYSSSSACIIDVSTVNNRRRKQKNTNQLS